jgi:hypothetical protein
MSLARKSFAKYGAKIPTAPSTGAKQARQGKQAAPVGPSEEADRVAKKSADKKR